MTAEPLHIVPHRPPRVPPRPGPLPRGYRVTGTGRGYSRFVALLKVMLPILAFGILAMLVAWPSLQDTAAPQSAPDGRELEMMKPRYVGLDDGNRPFSVVADEAVRPATEPSVMDLVRPEAEMTRDDGTWVTIRADRGRYNEQSGKLLLMGHVNLFHDRGYEFLTDEAHVDTKLGTAWGDRPVTGQGPLGELFGSGFRLYDGGKTIVVTGPAHLNLVTDGTEVVP